MNNDETPRVRATGIQRAFAVCSIIAEAEFPLKAAEINRTLRLPKATLHRLCQNLEDAGLLQRAMDGKAYVPGPKFIHMAFGVISNSAMRTERTAILRRLGEKIGETCNLAVPDGDRMRYIDRYETEWPLRLQLPVGSYVPLHCTASGKLYLACLTSTQRKRLLRTLPLIPHTINTFTDPDELAAELKLIRARKVGIENEEFLNDMLCLSVPINAPSGKMCATLSIHVPKQRMTFEEACKHIPDLKAAAADLSALIALESASERESATC